MDAQMKRCPFCGSANVDPQGWASRDPDAQVSSSNREGPACDDCGATADTLEMWNRRASEACDPSDPVETFLAEVRAELASARLKFPGDRIMTLALAGIEATELARGMVLARGCASRCRRSCRGIATRRSSIRSVCAGR